jgi:crotonobetainyl-CoA:carnitine CoA-transferase CaiB-like acyl-CoA transferase
MLEGIKVLDLTRVLAGPLCTMLLGDLGADVLKVERPDSGDDTRGWGPPFDASGRSAYYLSVNRNKLGIAADLDSPEDRQLVQRLMAGADIVVENFRPGTMERRGLGAEEMCSRHPRLVWCTITGFGLDSDRPGYDYVVQAECGWMAITGAPGGEPMKVGVALADVLAGKDAAIAILAALVARGKEGAGRRLVISLAKSAGAALVNVAQNSLVSGTDARRWGNAHPNLVPYELFPTADRPIVVAVGSDAQFRACALALGLDELAADPTLATNAGRVGQRARVVSAFTGALRRDGAAAWQSRLAAAGVPSGIVRGVLDAVREAGGSPLTGMPSSVCGTVRRPPPGLDEHGPLVRQKGWDAFG